MAVLMALGTEEPAPVRDLNPNVPDRSRELIHQLLAKKAEDRPPSAAEVVAWVRAVAAGEDVGPLTRTGPTLYPVIQVTGLGLADPFADLDADPPGGGDGPFRHPVGQRRPGGNRAAGAPVGVAGRRCGGAAGRRRRRVRRRPCRKKPEPKAPAAEVKAPAAEAPPKPRDVKPVVTAPPDPDRKAAEWVLGGHGRVRVHGIEGDVAAPDLPRGAFTLTLSGAGQLPPRRRGPWGASPGSRARRTRPDEHRGDGRRAGA